MVSKVFDINEFNIFKDDENYYFFRALNMGDNNDIENKITLTADGEISKIRTDRERYEETPMYNSDSSISLIEMFDHIKMHHRTDTNCISLTSNANAAVLYGRGYYKDKYIVVKVPKIEFGSKVYNAGQYMMIEINKIIDDYLKNNELDDVTKYYLSAIDNATTEQKLNEIMEMFKQKQEEKDSFEKGIIYKNTNTTSVDYQALNLKQNFEKNKMIAKINVLGKNIIPNVANKFLIQTLGNAFSSLELIHYNDIEKQNIIEVSKEMLDVLALIQQVPEDYPLIEELKEEIINTIINKKYIIQSFDYANIKLNTEQEYTIENMYNLTEGNVDFNSSINLYKKSFYLVKSKLRTLSSVNLLMNLVDNEKYKDILSYLKKQTYGVEPEIFSRQSSNRMKISESVNLDFNPNEKELFEFIDNLSVIDLNYIINNPKESLKYYLKNFKSIEHKQVDKDTYYANAIIDLFDWSKLDIVGFSSRQRNQLVESLKNSNIVTIYNVLKDKGVNEADIANVLLTTIIKQKSLNEISLKDTFTVEELEDFLGYYKINGTKGLKLRSYQAVALNNIDKAFQNKQFTTAVLPTGAGKSFVALAEMLEHSDEDILYLAPNDEILNQIEKYILEIVCDESLQKTDKEKIKEKFKHLKLCTYASLLSDKRNEVLNGFEQETIHHRYGLIVFDELHRSGAKEWEKSILELLEYQDENTKVLGITATPIRDMDDKNMADRWAEYFGYTEEEIQKRKHLAINMELEEAISLGYVMNPKVVQCEYNLEKDGSLERLKEKIGSIEDENLKTSELLKFEELRRRVLEADGIEKVIGDNLKQGGKYIIFCPVVNKNGNVVETIDGYEQNYRISGKEVIEKYIKEMILNIIKYRGIIEYDLKENDDFDKFMQVADELGLQFNSLLGSYSKSKNQYELEQFEKNDPDKIKFVTVINKLNEGVHVDGVDGIIWLRPLDENSKILFLQQFGRIIYSIDPNKPIKDEDRTIAIDISNNTFRVNMNKSNNGGICDLDKLIIISGWIEQHNGRIPDLNSSDKIESNYGSTLKSIQTKYIKYINDVNLLNELSLKQKLEVQEIIDIGSNINLWTISFPEKIKKTDLITSLNSFEYDKFAITSVLKDYYELSDEIDSIDNSQWMKNYKLAKEYYEEHGDLEVKQSFQIKGVALGRWINRQRQTYKQGKLSEDRIQLLRDIGMRFETNKNELEWMKNYKLAKEYYEEYGDLEVKESFQTKEVALGRWIDTQRQTYKQGKLSEDRIQLLRDIGMRFEIKNNELEWMKNYELAKEYYEEHGNLEVKGSFQTKGVTLGKWIGTQRQIYKQGKLNEDRIQLLRDIGMRFEIKNNELEWMKNYKLAKEYYEEYGDLEVKQSFQIKGVALGRWINRQRQTYKQGKLNEDQINLLKNIGMCFEIKNNELEWMKNYELAKEYYEEHGNLELKESFQTKGVALGKWINRQRQTYKQGKLNEDQINLLKNIGMCFETNKNELEWMKNYELAKEYYKEQGNLEVSQRFEIKGVALGQWIKRQRIAYKQEKLSDDRIELLRNIGMNFETNKNELEWMKNYELAKEYYKEHGNLEVPARFETKGVALGIWIYTQRKTYEQGKLSKNRIKLLRGIGMRFETNKNELEWMKNYELAKEYYEEHGNLEVKGNFQTKGVALGQWIKTQRKVYKQGKLSEERIQLLRNIGMRFEIDQSEKKLNEQSHNEDTIETLKELREHLTSNIDSSVVLEKSNDESISEEKQK